MSTAEAASAVRVRSTFLRSEWTWLGLASVFIVALYLLLKAPVFNPGGNLDPWIYTALMVNFKYLYQTFNSSYYTSRLPWLIPGIAAHAIFGPEVAFFVLHGVFFFGAGLFAYLTVRHFFGSTVGLATYVVLMVSPLFYAAYITDYPDGALLTFLFGGVYFGVTAERSRRPLVRAAASGFFLAAAAGTNLFACIVIVFLLILYGMVRLRSSTQLSAIGREVAAAFGGAVLLLVACGSFAKAYGGEFLFFMPSVRANHTINSANYKAAGYSWLLDRPQLMLPIFLILAVSAAYLFRGERRRDNVAYRFAVGAAASLATFYALLVIWEFAFTGDFLETSYYFSLLNVWFIFCAGAVLSVLWETLSRAGIHAAWFVCAVSAAAVVPLLLVEGAQLSPSGRGVATAISGALMAVALALLLARRRFVSDRLTASLTVGGMIVVVAAFGYTAAVGGAHDFARGSYDQRRDVQAVSFQLIDFMRSHGLQSDIPAFWYNPHEDPNLNGIQSTYLWGTTLAGLDMPRIDTSMRRALDQRKPSNIVLLCHFLGCRGGPAALREAGYRPQLVASGVLSSGAERVFVRAFRIPKYAAAAAQRNDPIARYYAPTQAAFSVDTSGRPLHVWSFGRGAPGGWSGAAADVSRATSGQAFDTSSRQWDYEIVSPKLQLAPGTYAAYLRGRVTKGGLDLGILDNGSNAWLVQSLYWYRQRGFDKSMAARVTITAPSTVQVVLSNWVPSNQSSTWRLDSLRLVRVGP